MYDAFIRKFMSRISLPCISAWNRVRSNAAYRGIQFPQPVIYPNYPYLDGSAG